MRMVVVALASCHGHSWNFPQQEWYRGTWTYDYYRDANMSLKSSQMGRDLHVRATMS